MVDLMWTDGIDTQTYLSTNGYNVCTTEINVIMPLMQFQSLHNRLINTIIVIVIIIQSIYDQVISFPNEIPLLWLAINYGEYIIGHAVDRNNQLHPILLR